MKKKIFSALFLALCIGLLVAALSSWHFEKLDTIVRLEIEKYAKENLPVNIQIESTSVQLLPVSLAVQNIVIDPKKEMASKIKPIKIESIRLQPNLFHLLWGRFTIKKLAIHNTAVIANIPNETQGESVIDLDKILNSIPIQQLDLSETDLDLTFKVPSGTYKVFAVKLNAKVVNDIRSIMCKLKTESLTVTSNKEGVTEKAAFETQFFLTNKNLVLSDFKFQEKNSFILASGSTQHDLKKKKIVSSNINVRLQTNIRKIESLLKVFLKNEDLSAVAMIDGQLRGDTLLTSAGVNQFNLQSDISLVNFSIENFHIGEIQAEGIFNSQKNTVIANRVRMNSPGVKALISDFKMNLDELSFQDVKVDLQQFELHDYLKYAIRQDIPAYAHATGSVVCAGTFKSFNIKCPGSLKAHDAKVNSSGKNQIIAVDSISGDGTVSVDANQVNYTVALKTPTSQGRSSGTINYKTGFNIDFETPQLSLDEIKKISALELGGVAAIKGSTQGNSKSAVFEMQIDAKNGSLDGYKLGDLSTKLNFKTGVLYFNKMQGTLSSSRYLGNLEVDLNKEWLSGKIQVPFVDLAVAQESIRKQLDIPFPVTGTGSAIVNLDSPLDAKKLSFKVKSRIYNAVVDQQHVDTIDVDLQSSLGQIEFKQLVAEEKKSRVIFTGKLDLTERVYGIDFKSDTIYLDDIDYTQALTSSTKGVFAVDGKIRGPLSKPELDVKFSSDLFQISGQRLSPLQGGLIANPQKITLDIKGPENLSLKYRDFSNASDVQIEGQIEKINLAPFLTNLMKLETLEDYEIFTTSKFNLKLNKKDRSMISGYIFIPEIRMVFQKNEMRNEKEMTFFLSNSRFNFSPFVISGESGSLTMRSSNSDKPFDMQITGSIALSYLQIFAPFLETLEGRISLNLKVQSDFKKVTFMGSAFIDDGFVKLPQIPHAVESLDVDILFNQDQLIINSMKGRFASGQLYGDGKILIKGPKDIPTFLNLHLESVDLNIPNGVRTKGNANLQLSGQWLPLTLAGTYDIYDGLISKELTGGDSSSSNPHEIFLPPDLRDTLSSPIRLDLTITPLVPLKIKNTMIDGKIEGQIKVVGDPSSPVLAGTISLVRNSQIKFQDVTFKAVDSSFAFKGQEPPDPEIYLLADTRYKNHDIEMLIQGTASRPKFKLSSSPSLSEPEIISLLTLGTTPQEQEAQAQQLANSTQAQQRRSSVEFRSDLFSKIPLSKEFKERFGVDVKFSPTFDSESNVAAPKVSVGYQVSEKVTATGSVQGGTESRAEANVRYDLNRNFGARFSVQTENYEENNQLRGNIETPPEILGIGLDYRKEFK
ncbi:MAG: translocation/assembly module TamB [Bdellovibrionales bacterium]|nr:translocation/assembly module TamB [Bdellovibrionales bacterium]